MKHARVYALLLSLCLLLLGCVPTGYLEKQGGGSAGPRVRWRLASSYPPTLDTIFGGADSLAEKVETMSGGQFTIRVFAAGEFVPALGVFDAVEAGSAEIGHTASYYYIGKEPALAFGTSMPFGLTARQQTAWLYEAGGAELMQREIYDQYNMLALPGGNTGVQMGGWFRKPVNSLEDMQGLRMRIPGIGGKIMAQLGVSVQNIAGGDIYPALDRGAIDATEWVGPYDDEKLGFYQAARFYYYPGWWEPGPELTFLVNQEAFDKLPKQYQEILRTASQAVHNEMIAKYDARNPAAVLALESKGVELRPFPQDVLEKAYTLTQEYMEAESARNPRYRAIYEHWKAFRGPSDRWFGLNARAYANFIDGTLDPE